jgi:hypothetical protein
MPSATTRGLLFSFPGTAQPELKTTLKQKKAKQIVIIAFFIIAPFLKF